MATHKELITSGKFDEKFARCLLNYYNYGFKNESDFSQSKKTIRDDWTRLNSVVSDYLEWSGWDDRKKVMFASSDSQSMDDNPFHRIYRFCKYVPITYPAYFLHIIAALSKSFELRNGVDSLNLDINSKTHIEELISSDSDYKTSDLMLLIPELEKLENESGEADTEKMRSELSTGISLINSAIGGKDPLRAEVKKISFKYIRTSVLKDTSSKKQPGKDYVVSPYYTQFKNGSLYLLAKDNMDTLRVFRVDHMVDICVLDKTGEPLILTPTETLQDRFNTVLAAQNHNNAVKALTIRLDELDACGFIHRDQGKGKSGKIGDRHWSLPELTIGKIMEAGSTVNSDFERHFYSALKFFSNYYLFGEVGTFLLDRISNEEINPFRFKHDYFMQSLNDFNIIDLLYAIGNNKWCKIKYSHGTAGFETELLCFPLEIRVSNTQGREFLVYYEPIRRSYTALRIEFINSIEYYDDDKVKSVLIREGYHSSTKSISSDIKNAKKSIKYSWGVSTTKQQTGNAINPVEPHSVCLQIACDPKKEFYIVNRLNSECRSGKVPEPGGNPFLKFSADISDEVELRPWVRSFYSRIISCSGMDSETFSLDADVEKITDLLLHDTLTPPQKKTSSKKGDVWSIPEAVIKALGNGAKAKEHDLLFNEVFSIYYYITADVFTQLCSGEADKTYTENEIDKIINSSFNKHYLRIGEETKELLPTEIKELLLLGGFLEKTIKTVEVNRPNSTFKEYKKITAYLPKYHCKPEIDFYRETVPLSKIELRWLKTIITEKRINLFMSSREVAVLDDLLNCQAPTVLPFPKDKIIFFDRYHSKEQINEHLSTVLKTILEGIYKHKTVRIKYHSMKNDILNGEFKPIVLEFSKRNNKFQALCQKCGNDRIYTMNVYRIIKAEISETAFDYRSAELSLLDFRKNNLTSVTVEFYDVFNIADRILTEFSPWKKLCSYDPDTDLYTLTIYYQKRDEMDLVDRLLGYAVSVRFPDKKHPIYNEMLIRVNRQKELISERRGIKVTER